ncbi:MAG TPA: hypothetical protein VFN36_00470 [Solirubrobacteraceae bacterium]|nr:hypothetical protein [Solirubrobacteraceae bacterium]
MSRSPSARLRPLAILVAVLACLLGPAVAGAATTHTIHWGPSRPLLNPSYGGGFDAVSCAPVSTGSTPLFCLAADVRGDIFATVHPALGASQWRRRFIDPRTAITGVACPSAQLCVAVDASGQVLHTTTPLGPVSAWSKPALVDKATETGGGYAGFASVACPTTTFCVAVDNAPDGQIAVTTDPTGPASAWTLTTVGSGVLLDSVACPTTTLCVVGGNNVYYSTDPTGGATAWKATAALSTSYSVVSALACDTPKLCLGVGYGNAGVGLSVGSSTPTTTTWSQGLVGADPPAPGAGVLDGVACPERNFCVAVDGASNAYVTNTPVRGAWSIARPLKPASQSTVSQVSCNSAICVEVDNRGTVAYGVIHSVAKTTSSTRGAGTSTQTTTTSTTTTKSRTGAIAGRSRAVTH